MNSRKLLRQPGQSLREELARRFDDFVPLLMIVFAFWVVFVIELVQKLVRQQPDPGVWLLVSLGLTVYGGAGIFRLRARLRNLRRGEIGERTVAQILDPLRAKGFVMVHDVPGDGFNIDHIAIGPSGIYAIETKYRGAAGVIDYRGDDSLVVGRINETRALRQARGVARAVRMQLKENLRGHVGVKALLVFVGDWKVRRAPGDFNVDVVSADQLENYFDRQQPELTRKDIEKISLRLEHSARA